MFYGQLSCVLLLTEQELFWKRKRLMRKLRKLTYLTKVKSLKQFIKNHTLLIPILMAKFLLFNTKMLSSLSQNLFHGTLLKHLIQDHNWFLILHWKELRSDTLLAKLEVKLSVLTMVLFNITKTQLNKKKLLILLFKLSKSLTKISLAHLFLDRTSL